MHTNHTKCYAVHRGMYCRWAFVSSFFPLKVPWMENSPLETLYEPVTERVCMLLALCVLTTIAMSCSVFCANLLAFTRRYLQVAPVSSATCRRSRWASGFGGMAGMQPLAYVVQVLLLYNKELLMLNYIVCFSTSTHGSWNYRSKTNVWFIPPEAQWLSSCSVPGTTFNNVRWWKITFSSVLLPILKNVLYFFRVQLAPINPI